MKRSTILLIAFILLSAVPIFAKYSDEFPIGVYSYMRNGNTYFEKHSKEIAALQRELGFNCSIIETSTNDKDLSSLLRILDENKTDAIIIDKAWSNDPSDPRMGAVVGISMGHYYRFEAEFVDSTSVVPGDGSNSVYWYGTAKAANNRNTPSRVGKPLFDATTSYKHTWKCTANKDNPGFAYTDITFRWLDTEKKANKLGHEVRIFKTNPSPGRSSDSLRVTFRVKLSNMSVTSEKNVTLLTYYPLGFVGNSVQFVDSILVASSKGNSFGKFALSDYRAMGSPKEYFNLTFALSYSDLLSSKIMTDDFDNNPNTAPTEWWYYLYSMLTRLYWHGGFDLELDYVEIEDQMHYDLRNNPQAFKTRINRRLRDLVSLPYGDIISHIYCIDEPYQTQLDSFTRIQDLIEPGLPPVMTASYDINYKQFLMSNGKDYWDMVDLVRNTAKPRFFMPDMYPVRPGISYTYGENRFIQDLIDHQVLRVYRESKQYTLSQSDRKFYPVVQSFGKWDGKYWQSWMQPARATLRALMYLPLCYAPDGIFNFYLTGVVNEKTGAGDICPISSVGGKTISTDNLLWEVNKEVNPQLSFYGKLLKQMKWLGAYTVMTGKNATPTNILESGIKDITVRTEDKSDYDGYIECGFYTGTNNAVSMFAVNRRTDRFTGLQADKMRYPDQVSPSMYDERYVQYPPQTLIVEFAKGAMGSFPALYNPLNDNLWLSEKNAVEIQLKAGDGQLLQAVGSLPAKVTKGNYLVKNKGILRGNISVEKKAIVYCDGDLVLLPGTVLTLKKGSRLIVSGKLTVMEGAKINSQGDLELN